MADQNRDARYGVPPYGEPLYGEVVTSAGVRVFVNGNDISDQVLLRSLELRYSSEGNIGTASFQGFLNLAIVRPGLTAEILENDTLLFVGKIRSVTSEPGPPGKDPLVSVTVRDLTEELDSIFIDRTTFSGAYDGAIIKSLMNTYAPGWNTDNVRNVRQIVSITLEPQTLRDAIGEVARLGGGAWWATSTRALHYVDVAEPDYVPFGLSDSPDDASLFPARRPVSYDLDASRLANKVTVIGPDRTETTTITLLPAASGDDGFVKRSGGASWPPTSGSTTVDTSASTLEIEGTRVEPNPQSAEPPLIASGGWTKGGLTYPPDGSLWNQEISGSIAKSRAYPEFYIDVALFLFDATGISGTIQNATLTVILSSVNNDDGRSVGIDFPGDWRPSDEGDWTSGSGGIQIDLANGVRQVDVTPYFSPSLFGVRFTVTGGAPTGLNSAVVSCSLSVTYVPSPDPTYTRSVALLRFDTSSIPDDATVKSAALRLYLHQLTNNNGGQIGGEWYSPSNWPIDTGDYTNTDSNSALGYTNLSALTGGYNTFGLTNAGSNVSKNGYTAIRLNLHLENAPTGTNRALFRSVDASSGKPELVVTYEIPASPYQSTAEDAASQQKYGLHARTIRDTSISSQSHADQLAQTELARWKDPKETVRVTFTKAGAEVGKAITLDFPSVGASGVYLIRELTRRWELPDRSVYTITAGEFRPDLIRFLRSLTKQ